MNFDIKLTPESQAKVDGLVRASKIDLRPVLSVIGIGYRKEVSLIFNKQQSREDGLRWKPLSEPYATYKEKKYPDKPLLVRTGLLLNSMTQEGAEGNISIINKTGAIFGSTVPYGIYHDSQEERIGKLPMRNFSEPSDNRLTIWIEQIRASIQHNFEVNGISVDGDIIQ